MVTTPVVVLMLVAAVATPALVVQLSVFPLVTVDFHGLYARVNVVATPFAM